MSSSSSLSASPLSNVLVALNKPVQARYVLHNRVLNAATEEEKCRLVDQEFRVFGTRDDPLYETKALCAALGIARAAISKRLKTLEDDEHMQIEVNGERIHVVTESGFLQLLSRSDNRVAKAFQLWVRNEVIPSIFRTGSYTAPAEVMEQIECYKRQIVEHQQNTQKMLEDHEKEKEKMKKEAEEREDTIVRDGLAVATDEEIEATFQQRDFAKCLGGQQRTAFAKEKCKNLCPRGCRGE